ncbi:MAG: hypothetical protein DRI32_08160 [Chloroflexi bacterium]|nr:MAG: hypothetical protein DRI32_08160 [Chloroflexota bacterium]
MNEIVSVIEVGMSIEESLLATQAEGIRLEVEGKNTMLTGILTRGKAYLDFEGSQREAAKFFGFGKTTINDYLSIYQAFITDEQSFTDLEEPTKRKMLAIAKPKKNAPSEKKTNAKTEEVYTKEQVMELLMRVKNGEEIEFNGQTIKVEFTDVEVIEPVGNEKSEFTIEDVDYDFIFNNINELWSKLEAYEKNQMDRMGVISELHYVKMDGLALAAICHSGMVEASDVTRVLNHFGDMKQKDIAIKLGVSSTAVGVMQSGKPIKQGGKVARAIGEYIFNNRCEIQ